MLSSKNSQQDGNEIMRDSALQFGQSLQKDTINDGIKIFQENEDPSLSW